MGFLGKIGSWLWNGAKGTASSFGFDTSSYENDEGQRFQAQQAQMNRDWQESMLQKQMDYQTEMWNKTNAYNSAKSQMDRYRQAGLNPYLMMTGGASAGVATSQGSPSAPSAPSPSGGFAGVRPSQPGQALKNYQDFKVGIQDEIDRRLSNNRQEIENRYLEVELIEKIIGMQKDNESKGINNSYLGYILDATYKKLNSETMLNDMQAKKVEAETVYQNMINKNYPQEFAARMALAGAEIRLKLVNGDLTIQQAKTEVFRTITEYQRSENLRLDNKEKDAIFDAVVAKAYYEGYEKMSNPAEAFSRLGQHASNFFDAATNKVSELYYKFKKNR